MPHFEAAQYNPTRMTAHSRPPSGDADTGLHPMLADLGGFLRHLYARMTEDRTRQSASALTFVSLFALVPMLTVSYAILSMVPAFEATDEQIQDFVFRHFVPSTGAEVQQYLRGFAEQARRLTAAGTVLLVLSAYLMLKTIETQFNHIWRVREHRRGLANFLIYWAVLSLGPLLLGAGLLVSTYLFSLSVFSDVPQTLRVKSLALLALPQLFTFATFTLMYRVVPNCHVPLRHAALGGALAALAFEAGKWLFGWIVGQGSYTLIYGTFAALPLFLLWIHLSWQILLTGAEFVYALSTYRSRRAAQLPDLLVALGVLERLYRLHQNGSTLRESELTGRAWLFGRYSTEPVRWQRLRERLLDARLLRETQEGEYVLGISADSVSLWSLYTLVGTTGALPDASEREQLPPWCRTALATIEAAERGLRQALDPSLEDVFTTGEQEAGNDTAN
jgi:membrane protein